MLPKGYAVFEISEDFIVIGMTDFLLIFEDAAPIITYESITYRRGPLELIPTELVGHVCSMRKYYKLD